MLYNQMLTCHSNAWLIHLLKRRSASGAVFCGTSSLRVVLTGRLMRYDFALSGTLPEEMRVQCVLIRSYLAQFLITLISADNHQTCRLVFCLCGNRSEARCGRPQRRFSSLRRDTWILLLAVDCRSYGSSVHNKLVPFFPLTSIVCTVFIFKMHKRNQAMGELGLLFTCHVRCEVSAQSPNITWALECVCNVLRE